MRPPPSISRLAWRLEGDGAKTQRGASTEEGGGGEEEEALQIEQEEATLQIE